VRLQFFEISIPDYFNIAAMEIVKFISPRRGVFQGMRVSETRAVGLNGCISGNGK